MANEGYITINLTVNKGGFKDSRPALQKNFDIAGVPYVSSGVQLIGTTEEAVAISSDLSTLGYCVFVNQDTTNYIELGIVQGGTFYPFTKLKPGEPQAFRSAVAYNALYAKANTAAAKLEFRVYQD